MKKFLLFSLAIRLAATSVVLAEDDASVSKIVTYSISREGTNYAMWCTEFTSSVAVAKKVYKRSKVELLSFAKTGCEKANPTAKPHTVATCSWTSTELGETITGKEFSYAEIDVGRLAQKCQAVNGKMDYTSSPKLQQDRKKSSKELNEFLDKIHARK